ncbi:MAG: hypothetical protein Q9167_007947 [Letrouitia subvulpina]
MANSKLAFIQTVKPLMDYSLIEGIEGLSSYATHPVVHEWAWRMLKEEEKVEYYWLAIVIIAEAVPSSSEKNFWILQRRFLPHAGRRVGYDLLEIHNNCDKQRNSIEDLIVLAAYHKLGILYRNQGKLSEAEEMYQRALQGREKAFFTETKAN